MYSPEERKISVGVIQPIPLPALMMKKAKVVGLSDDEIEQSRQEALKRLEEDTKFVGYQRGKLIQTESGKWAIFWKLELSDRIGIKG